MTNLDEKIDKNAKNTEKNEFFKNVDFESPCATRVCDDNFSHKIEILSYVIESLNAGIMYLETVEDSRYSLYEAQLLEMCTNFESERNELIEKLSIKEENII